MSMGVYVFDMEMPRSCNECRFSVNGFCRASPKLAVGAAMSKRERTNYCPLVYVPPHGRCIDADALIDDVRRHSESYFADDFAHEWVDKAPTIIPAELEEEGE